jgi:hypothetical protein
MTTFRALGETVPIAFAAGRLADLGFLAGPDLPDRPGPAYLLVALRDHPTLRHYDPERIEFWASGRGRAVRRALTRATPMPLDVEVSWGLVRLVDRVGASNEYLTFGGRVSAAAVDDATVAVFRSPVPLLCRGGHSQLWDDGADLVAAFFGRLAATLTAPGLEAEVAGATAEARYCAFLADIGARYRRSPELQTEDARLWSFLRAEETQMRAAHPEAWRDGERLVAAIRQVRTKLA